MRSPPITKQVKDKDKALVFAQDVKKTTSISTIGDDSLLSKGAYSTTSKKPTNVCCWSCEKLGHTLAVCPVAKPLMQVHAMSADVDNASVASNVSSIIILAQNTRSSSIDANFLLLNSQSTINLFSNLHHVSNVHPAACPINVHCNKGLMTTNTVANFGANKVYLKGERITNILLLYLLGQKHHITYDSCNRGGVLKVHTSDGLLEFKPTPKGLHILDLQDTPEVAHLLVASSQPSPDHPHINTVCENFKGFTKKQVKWAHEACCLMPMMGVPTEQAFLSMVRLNQLKDCPVTHDDIKNAHAIFGSDLANIRRKTVWWSPARVETDYVEIPRDLLSFHENMMLDAYVMFVNSIPFQVLALHNIHLITIEHTPKHCSASKLGYLLQRIINVYAWVGFCLQTILMNNEFKKVGPST
jgi:hypothetical protein